MNRHLDLPFRVLTAVAGLTAVAAAVAAPAQADPIDDAFLAAVTDAGIGLANPVDTVRLGESVCPMLVEPGRSFARVYTQVADSGIPPEVAAFFTGIAISVYCPQMIASVGDGTMLDWLPAARAIPGL
ncbi:DUF732 domain-containing protein [Mycobacterium sp. IDR2000157661]|uniref:DUF732 domain-containing protein n=1 Tax=Mycobacterium sp. IDR2000157661 TaxID=2867005 RepID=UPI001EEC50C2|nr:DUF732 domain-containing protein [Mycobacterium sp. IDR2000157661]ULE31856.1 DUF732 domain-containing protein [Mycobacterium sp. IDR2000157661]